MGDPGEKLSETPFPLTPREQAVLDQVLRFEAALPELLATHAGRWAVWLDGLRSTHDTHEAAHAWAAQHLPAESAFGVARDVAATSA